jgi:hypothetical protein
VIAAFILWQPEFWGRTHEVRWLACIAGPIIGLCAYYGSRWSYKKRTAIRVIWAVVSLYLAAGVYGLVLGLLVWPSRSASTSPEATRKSSILRSAGTFSLNRRPEIQRKVRACLGLG